MAILNNLIVHGRSRFLNGINTDSIHTNLIDADSGIFKTITTTTLDAGTITTDMLDAANARVSQTLTVDGTISTNKWEAANIANIGGNFYISPTGKADSGTITVTKTGSDIGNGVTVGVYTIEVGNSSFGVSSTSSTVWGPTSSNQSKVIFTGSISYPRMSNADLTTTGKKYPLGTCDGTMTNFSVGSGNNPSITGFKITGVKSFALDVFFKENGIIPVLNTAYYCSGYEMQISVYKSYRSNGNTLHPIGILLTSYGKDSNQYIDIYDSTTSLDDSVGGFSNPSVRIGNLDGLPNIRDGDTAESSPTKPSGWGIYTTNGFFKGKIVSNAGLIGNFTLSASALFNGNNNINDIANGVYLSGTAGLNISGGSNETTITIANSNFTKTINGVEHENLRVAIGSNFGMDADGRIYATGADITDIDGRNIRGDSISAEKLSIGKYMLFGNQKTLLTSQPSDWATNWKNYYRADVAPDSYIRIQDQTCPTWAANTFYMDDNTKPQITIGNKSNYAIVIDNNQMTFWNDNAPVAYINEHKMVIPESVMLDEMIVGHDNVLDKDLWSWKKHGRNLCLKWLGG